MVRMVDIWKVEGKVRQGEQGAVHEKVSMVGDSKTDCLILCCLFSWKVTEIPDVNNVCSHHLLSVVEFFLLQYFLFKLSFK